VPSLTVENYLKAIYLISSRRAEADAVATGELAQALAVSPGTVTGMLKTLSEADLATYTPYEGARLTPSGRRLALKVLRRHRLLELFLAQTLRMTWDEVHEEAEHMEHAASDRLIDRIDDFLGNPAVDPHGDPIPRPDGSLTEPLGTPLAHLERGARFRVVRVVEQDPAFLRYLTECGLDLGAEGELIEVRPEAGILAFRLRDRDAALGFEAAGKILVARQAVDGP
jgi:DtxR family transcriptional regulator, Mn-dependent transcriptional regulator